MEVGVWGLSSMVFPNERRYIELRQEGDSIIQLIRQLNAAALVRDQGEDAEDRFQAALDEVHGSVHRMAELAARENGPHATSG